MPKLITTSGTSHYIEQIIKKASKSIILVTPYLKLSSNFIERLHDADKSGVQIILIYGKDKLADDQMTTLHSFENLEIFFCKNLHAKCYFNENSMVITSMNLYEFSEKNNRELGIYLERYDDEEIYEDSVREIKSIINASKKIKSTKKKVSLNFNSKEEMVKSPPESKKVSKILEYLKNPDNYIGDNFHLNDLYDRLKWKYNDYKMSLNDEIEIEDFPKKGSHLVVSNRVDWIFDKNIDYKKAKLNCEKNRKFNDEGIRCYFNGDRINIYPQKGAVFNNDLDGLFKKVNTFFDIIYTIQKDLKP